MEKSFFEAVCDHATMVRRAFVAVGVAGTIAATLRMAGSGQSARTRGGWTELTFEPEEHLGEMSRAEQYTELRPDALDE